MKNYKNGSFMLVIEPLEVLLKIQPVYHVQKIIAGAPAYFRLSLE